MPTAQMARRKAPRRNYSVDQRAMMLAALDANHGNVRVTAEQFGINESTLRTIRHDAEANTERGRRVRALRAEKRGEIAAASDDVAWEALQQTRDNLPAASARDAAVVFGIMVDKAQLLRGLPTAIVGQSDPRLAALDDAEFDEVLAILERAEQRRLSPVTVDAPALSATSAPSDTPLSPVPPEATPGA